jgi:hypothetical protein
MIFVNPHLSVGVWQMDGGEIGMRNQTISSERVA